MRDYQLKTNIGGVPDSNTSEKLGGSEISSIRTENKTAVSRSGQTLAPQDGTGEKTDQLAKSLFINGVAAPSMTDGGSANAYILTPVTGSSGLAFPETYAQLSGAIFEFGAGNANTGASTVDLGQTVGTLLGVKDIVLPGGGPLVGGEITGRVRILYDLSNDRFELISVIITGTSTDNNLLTNSGFEIWSNGTTENVGTQISISGIASGVCTTANTQGLVVGKLFEFDSGVTTGVYEVTAVTIDTNFTLHDTSITAASAHTGYEMTPGCVAADNKGPKGWYKSSSASCKIFREHNGSNTTDGSFYALKMANTENSERSVIWPSSSLINQAEHYRKFAGRTITLGAWVKYTGGADEARLAITQTSGTTYSSYHTGGGAYEWLELTVDIAPNTTTFYMSFASAGSSADETTYWQQPMLAFGSSIGSGNYSKPFGEIIELETFVTLANYDGVAVGASENTTLNIEAESLGKIGKGVSYYDSTIIGTPSAATSEKILQLNPGTIPGPTIAAQTTNQHRAKGFVNADSSGDFKITSSSVVTWSSVSIAINAIKLR